MGHPRPAICFIEVRNKPYGYGFEKVRMYTKRYECTPVWRGTHRYGETRIFTEGGWARDKRNGLVKRRRGQIFLKNFLDFLRGSVSFLIVI